MRPIATDVVCLSVCLSVTTSSPAKTAEPIEMPFGMQTGVGPKNYVVDGVQIPTRRGAFEGDDVGIFQHAVEHRS